jgi:hypothetical protein
MFQVHLRQHAASPVTAEEIKSKSIDEVEVLAKGH